MLFGPRHAEVRGARATTDDQVVVADRGAVREVDDVCVVIDRGDDAAAEATVPVAPGHTSDREGDVRDVQAGGCNLVQQRLERLEVVTVDQRDVDRRLAQCANRPQSGETGADHDDVRYVCGRHHASRLRRCGRASSSDDARILIGRGMPSVAPAPCVGEASSPPDAILLGDGDDGGRAESQRCVQVEPADVRHGCRTVPVTWAAAWGRQSND